MGAQSQGWLMDIIRGLFRALDSLVYNIIKWILYGIFDLSKVSGNSEIFGNIYTRIYIILGIFMAFKLSFSFFQYILDPDSMTKGDKSLTKLGSRVFFMIAALIFLPTFLFGTKGILNRAQNALLPVLPRVVFGVNSFGGGDVDTTVEASSHMISLTTLKAFFAPAEDLDELCGAGTFKNTPEIEDFDDFHNNLNETCNVRGTGLIAKKVYRYHYTFFISTVVGLLVAVLLLGVTLDIAKRIFKLIILEVIAPIPIMSLIDPKGSKDGAFSHWIKSLTTTFLDIFFKMGIVYVVIVFIQLIVQKKLFNDLPATGFRGAYLTVLLILGLIFFAKEAPKFIKDAMGIKDTGGGLFDDVKSIGKAAGLVGGVAVGTAGAIGAGVGLAKNSWDKDTAAGRKHNLGNIIKNTGAGLFGAAGGLATGAYGLVTSKEKNAKGVLAARNKFLANQRSGNTFRSRMLGAGASVFGGYDIDYEIKHAGDLEESAGRLRSYANGEGAKYYSDEAFDLKDAYGKVIGHATRNELQRAVSNASATGGNVIVTNTDGTSVNLGGAGGSLAKKCLDDSDEFVGNMYMDEVDSGRFFTRFNKTEDDTKPLENNRRAYSNVTGLSAKEVKKLRNKDLKVAEKSNKQKKENLKLKKGPNAK